LQTLPFLKTQANDLPHGGWLANLHHMKSHAKATEFTFMPPDHSSNCQLQISTCCTCVINFTSGKEFYVPKQIAPHGISICLEAQASLELGCSPQLFLLPSFLPTFNPTSSSLESTSKIPESIKLTLCPVPQPTLSHCHLASVML
jgi:hypothetical protein